MPVKLRPPSSPSLKPKSSRPRWISADLHLFASNAMFSIMIATVSMFFLSDAPLSLAGIYGIVLPGYMGSSWLGRVLKKSGEYESLIEQWAFESSAVKNLTSTSSMHATDLDDSFTFTARYLLTRPYLMCFSVTMLLFSFSMRSLAVLVIGGGMAVGWSCFAWNIFGGFAAPAAGGSRQPS